TQVAMGNCLVMVDESFSAAGMNNPGQGPARAFLRPGAGPRHRTDEHRRPLARLDRLRAAPPLPVLRLPPAVHARLPRAPGAPRRRARPGRPGPGAVLMPFSTAGGQPVKRPSRRSNYALLQDCGRRLDPECQNSVEATSKASSTLFVFTSCLLATTCCC